MAIVAINISGREYQLACDDGQEEHLGFLANEVDGRVRALSAQMGGRLNESMGLLLAAITMADELVENKRQIANPVGYNEGAVVAALNEIANRMETIAERKEMR
jgi:cell division protein ZapA